MKNTKKMYVSPAIVEHVVELEQGIAAGSNQGTTPETPGIEDWGNSGGGTSNGDL